MLLYLSQYLLDVSKGTSWAEWLSPLRVFKYITFRSAGAAVTALLLSWLLGPRVICWLKQLNFGQEYQDRAAVAGNLTRASDKKGTPTMGGLLIVATLTTTTLLWAEWNPLVALTLLAVVILCGLGFY